MFNRIQNSDTNFSQADINGLSALATHYSCDGGSGLRLYDGSDVKL